MADRNDIALARKQVGLAEGDPSAHELSGSRDDEDAGSILVELGTLVRLAGVLDREGVKVELNLDLPEHVQRRFEQPDPDHVIGLLGPCAGLVDRHVRDPPSMDIGAGGDHARGLGPRWSGNIARASPPMLGQ